MTNPIRCWCWNDGLAATRKTAPSIHWIREISATADGERHGVGVNRYPWSRVKPIDEAHPDSATDAALEAVYVARWQARNAVARWNEWDVVAPDIRSNFATMEEYRKEALESQLAPSGTYVEIAPSTEQPRPSALSRIWAILRGRG